MTKAQAIDSIPEIVEKAIPLTPLDDIKCAAKRGIAITNAKWRREELTRKIKTLIIRIDEDGVGVDLSELIDKISGDETY